MQIININTTQGNHTIENNRKQYTYINDVESKALISTHGELQGSVFGPLLLLTYIYQ